MKFSPTAETEWSEPSPICVILTRAKPSEAGLRGKGGPGSGYEVFANGGNGMERTESDARTLKTEHRMKDKSKATEDFRKLSNCGKF